MNILYLTNTRFAAAPYRDASTRYRCYNYAEALRGVRHVVDVGVIDVIDPAIVERYDIVIVLRPTMDRRLNSIANTCKSGNITLIADFDDLIFDPELAEASPVVKNAQATPELVEAQFKRSLDCLPLFDRFIVSTTELAKHLGRVVPDAEVLHLPNALSNFWMSYSKHLLLEDPTARLIKANGTLSGDITYLPGTRSHDHDFAEVQNYLAESVNSQSNCRVKIIGALEVDESLFNQGKLHRGTWKDFYELPQEIAGSWLTIAPLADSVFNRCKSHIKFIESAAFGTPHISSPLPDLDQHFVEGPDIVTDADGWQKAIEQYKDEEFYRHNGERLKKYAAQKCTADVFLPSLIEFLTKSNVDSNHEYSAALPQNN